MATIYSKRFLLEQGLSTDAGFTVEDGYVAILRDISGYFGSQATAPSIAVDVNGAKFFEADTPPLALTAFQWTGRVVMEAGDTCTATALNGNGDILISGYLLTAP